MWFSIKAATASATTWATILSLYCESETPLRVFIGLTEIAGYYSNLARGFRRLGIPHTLVDLGQSVMRYDTGPPANWLVRMSRLLAGRLRAAQSERRRPAKHFWKGLYRLSLVPLFVWAALTHQAFVFSFGTSFFKSYLDYLILRLLGRRIVHVFHGSDARPPYLSRKFLGAKNATKRRSRHSKRTKRRVRTIERLSHVVVNHPLSAHLHEKPFVQWFSVGIPFTARQRTRTVSRMGRTKVRILHCPSNPEVKGTHRIREAISSLRSQGLPIDYIELEGVPNAEVLATMQEVDFVVDQAYSDTPLAGVATEAAFFGKPAVVGGYGVDEFRRVVPDELQPPSVFCHPDDLERNIRELVLSRELRERLGRQAREYVTTRWSPRKVAERFLKLIEGDFPREWLYDPRDIRYVHGGGIDEDSLRKELRRFIDAEGKAALCLADKPALERATVDFACGKAGHDRGHL